MTDFNALIPEMSSWNNGKGIDVDSWIGCAGKSEIGRDDFIGQFDDHLEIGLMDHAGPLHRLQPMIEVSLFDDNW